MSLPCPADVELVAQPIVLVLVFVLLVVRICKSASPVLLAALCKEKTQQGSAIAAASQCKVNQWSVVSSVRLSVVSGQWSVVSC
jgi:hypothetical protein